MVADLFQTVRAQKTLLRALNGEHIEPLALRAAENILFANHDAAEDLKRDNLELKAFVNELKLAELEIEKAKNETLVNEITTYGITTDKQLVSIENSLKGFNSGYPENMRTLSDYQLFQIAREVDEIDSKLDYSGHENIENLHCHYINVVSELEVAAEKEGKEFDVEKVSEADLNKCSTKMSDFKPQSPTSLPRSAEKLRSEAEEKSITH